MYIGCAVVLHIALGLLYVSHCILWLALYLFLGLHRLVQMIVVVCFIQDRYTGHAQISSSVFVGRAVVLHLVSIVLYASYFVLQLAYIFFLCLHQLCKHYYQLVQLHMHAQGRSSVCTGRAVALHIVLWLLRASHGILWLVVTIFRFARVVQIAVVNTSGWWQLQAHSGQYLVCSWVAQECCMSFCIFYMQVILFYDLCILSI